MLVKILTNYILTSLNEDYEIWRFECLEKIHGIK